MVKVHARGLGELLVRCLHLAVQQAGAPAVAAPPCWPATAAAADEATLCWTGLPKDRSQAGLALVAYAEAALQLAIIMPKRGMYPGPPDQLLALEEALWAVVGSSGVSWMPAASIQHLRTVSARASQKLDQLFASCEEKIQVASRKVSQSRSMTVSEVNVLSNHLVLVPASKRSAVAAPSTKLCLANQGRAYLDTSVHNGCWHDRG